MIFEKYQCDIGGYVDENIHHTFDSDLNIVLNKLENCTNSLFTCYQENHMKPNGDKCHFVITPEKSVNVSIDGNSVKNI